MVNKKLSQKAAHLLNKKSEPFFPFREEFKFDFPDPSGTSSKHPFQTIRVKRDVSGVLTANEINAQNIETNKMFAKHVTADILKAERVNAIVISIGRAFSVTKAKRPTGSPDTLVLNRNGPDPTDTGVTIVLERGNAPVSLNGHPIHEEEKRKLLDLKNSFVNPISRRRTGGRNRIRANSHWRHTNSDLFKIQDNFRYRRPVNNQTSRRHIQSQRTKNTTRKLKSNRQSRFQKILPRQIRRQAQSTINTNTLRKLKPSRNQTFQKLQRRKTVYGRPNKYTSNHTTTLSSGRGLILTPLQRKRLILNHWRKKMTSYEKRKAMYAKRSLQHGSGKFKKWTRPYNHQLRQTVQPPNTKNLKPDKKDVQRTDLVTPSPIPQPTVYTGSIHQVVLPFKSFVHKKITTLDQNLGPVISNVQKDIHKNAKKAIGFKTSKESDYYGSSSFETEYDSPKEEYSEFDIEVPLKEFDRRNDWFNQDNHNFYYDDDDTEDGHFDESSDEIETYEGDDKEGDDKEEHMSPGRDVRIPLKGSDADGNFLISKYTVNTNRLKANDTSPFSGESYEYEFYSDESTKRQAEPKRLASTSNNTNKQMRIFKIGSNKEESMKMGVFSDYNYDSDYYSSDNIDSQDLYLANDKESKKTKKNNRRRNPEYFTDYNDSYEEEKLTYVKTKNRNVAKNSRRKDSFFSGSAEDFFNDNTDQSDYTEDFYSSREITDDTSKHTTYL